jgi:hypothetical protein
VRRSHAPTVRRERVRVLSYHTQWCHTHVVQTDNTDNKHTLCFALVFTSTCATSPGVSASSSSSTSCASSASSCDVIATNTLLSRRCMRSNARVVPAIASSHYVTRGQMITRTHKHIYVYSEQLHDLELHIEPRTAARTPALRLRTMSGCTRAHTANTYSARIHTCTNVPAAARTAPIASLCSRISDASWRLHTRTLAVTLTTLYAHHIHDTNSPFHPTASARERVERSEQLSRHLGPRVAGHAIELAQILRAT